MPAKVTGMFSIFHATMKTDCMKGVLLLSKKVSVYILMLAIGCLLLVLSLTIELPTPVKWAFLAIALLLNITSAVVFMKAGIRQMKPDQ